MAMPSMDYAKVAHLYDLYANTTFDVPFFLQEAETCAGPVLELMSGTGRVSLPLIEAGVDLCCVDVSHEMLEVLRDKLTARHLSADIHEADVTRLALGKKFDLAFIPFHSFSEILGEALQLAALRAIRSHLGDQGRFICTLHNPVSRLKIEDGRLRLLAESPLDDGHRLLVWGAGSFDRVSRVVNGKQLYEIYDPNWRMTSKMMTDVRFAVLWKADFERLAREAGFTVRALYGDYARTPFDEESSPFIIFELVNGEAPSTALASGRSWTWSEFEPR